MIIESNIRVPVLLNLFNELRKKGLNARQASHFIPFPNLFNKFNKT